jgi:hypothetical protein
VVVVEEAQPQARVVLAVVEVAKEDQHQQLVALQEPQIKDMQEELLLHRLSLVVAVVVEHQQLVLMQQ